VVPPPGYLQKVAEVCRRHGVLLIADEVMTGMGRTGRNFAIEHWDVAPDILIAAKGLSSGYAPLGALIATKKVVDGIASGSFLHGFTYNAHPVSLAAGYAVLRRLRQQKLVQASDSGRDGSVAATLERSLSTLPDLKTVGEVRGIGLLRGVEFVSDKKTKEPFAPELNFAGRVTDAALKRGLLVYPIQGCVDGISGDHLLVAPPAVITSEQIDWAVEQLRDSIGEVATSPLPL
jgi:adenosylmethionine-8-amino-7-oxononanoate aminotransferase